MSCISVKDFIGIPYVPHGRTMQGFDCYGLVIAYLKTQNIHLPDLFINGLINIKSEKLLIPQKNCIIMFKRNKTSHIGVYIGNGYFLHTTEDIGSRLERLSNWEKKIVGFYKVTD